MPRGQRPQHTVVRVPEHLQHVAQGANRRERRRALQRLPERLDLIRPGIELAPGPAEQVLEDRAEQILERLRVKRVAVELRAPRRVQLLGGLGGWAIGRAEGRESGWR